MQSALKLMANGFNEMSPGHSRSARIKCEICPLGGHIQEGPRLARPLDNAFSRMSAYFQPIALKIFSVIGPGSRIVSPGPICGVISEFLFPGLKVCSSR